MIMAAGDRRSVAAYAGRRFVDKDIEQARHQFVLLLRRGAYSVEFTRRMPTDWRPQQVINPVDGQPFTPRAAWHFVLDALARNEPLEQIELRAPAGKRGYVMVVDGIYIKLQLGSGTVIGRSFHYSTV
jgi:hypothetical protein